jgi:hypothetical protein
MLASTSAAAACSSPWLFAWIGLRTAAIHRSSSKVLTVHTVSGLLPVSSGRAACSTSRCHNATQLLTACAENVSYYLKAYCHRSITTRTHSTHCPPDVAQQSGGQQFGGHAIKPMSTKGTMHRQSASGAHTPQHFWGIPCVRESQRRRPGEVHAPVRCRRRSSLQTRTGG